MVLVFNNNIIQQRGYYVRDGCNSINFSFFMREWPIMDKSHTKNEDLLDTVLTDLEILKQPAVSELTLDALVIEDLEKALEELAEK